MKKYKFGSFPPKPKSTDNGIGDIDIEEAKAVFLQNGGTVKKLAVTPARYTFNMDVWSDRIESYIGTSENDDSNP